MKKLTIALLSAVTLSAHGGAIVEQIEGAQNALRANQKIMRDLGAALKPVQPVVSDGIKKIDAVQAQKKSAMAKVGPYQQSIENVFTAARFFGGLSEIGRLLKSSASAYAHAMQVSRLFDATATPLRKNLQSIESDLKAITKKGGLVDEIVAAQQEAIDQLDKARSLLTRPSDQPSEEFDF